MTNAMNTAEIVAALQNGDCLETTSLNELNRIASAADNHNVAIYTTIEHRTRTTYIVWGI